MLRGWFAALGRRAQENSHLGIVFRRGIPIAISFGGSHEVLNGLPRRWPQPLRPGRNRRADFPKEPADRGRCGDDEIGWFARLIAKGVLGPARYVKDVARPDRNPSEFSIGFFQASIRAEIAINVSGSGWL